MVPNVFFVSVLFLSHSTVLILSRMSFSCPVCVVLCYRTHRKRPTTPPGGSLGAGVSWRSPGVSWVDVAYFGQLNFGQFVLWPILLWSVCILVNSPLYFGQLYFGFYVVRWRPPLPLSSPPLPPSLPPHPRQCIHSPCLCEGVADTAYGHLWGFSGLFSRTSPAAKPRKSGEPRRVRGPEGLGPTFRAFLGGKSKILGGVRRRGVRPLQSPSSPRRSCQAPFRTPFPTKV